MNTNRRVTWCRLKWTLGTLLVPVLIASVPVRARADEDQDDEDDQVQVLQGDSDAADRAQEQRDRAQEERDRAREERERQREEARQQAEQAREDARQRAEEARQRKEEAQQRADEERERAKEEKQRAKEELERVKEEKQRAREEQNCHDHHDDGACDDAAHGAAGGAGNHGDKKSGRTTAKVKGPVRFSVDVVNADIQVSATGKDTVTISAKGCAPDDLELDGDDDEFEADFSEWGSCEGPVVVLLPSGSSVALSTVQGSIRLKGSYKEVEASSVAGSIEVEAGDDVQAEAVQGKVKIGSARRVHVESVAGDVELTTTGTSPIVEVETVNGQVRWTGACAKGCRASIETFQGSSILSLDKASSFELRFATQNGKFNDGMGTQASGNHQNVKGYSPVRAKYGKAEGTIRVETYQGGLELKKRP